ncbi:MAG: CCA-adding enzyme [Lentisphaerae bacterium ADurb.Bin242]|nr:MAG: CCA-adding enzyme [Lentisphaerae bacterium ADurb.Bin242]
MKSEEIHLSAPENSPEYRAAAGIVSALRGAGFEAYLVGGAVRDLVLGKTPEDYDVTTSAHPEQVTALFEHSIPVGAAFGVVTVVANSMNFEVATFREERDYEDGRRPGTLRYSRTPEEDVARRDFTVNALLFDPEKSLVIDFVGGLADLRRSVLRTIGDARTRFSEDYLRMLRAVRFAVRFRFELEKETAAAIRELSHKLVFLSAERVRDELTRMLCGPDPDRAFRKLSELGILSVVLPEVEAMHGVEQPEKFHPEGDVFEHTMQMLSHIAWPTPELGWAVLLHDAGKPPCRTVDSDGNLHFYGHENRGAAMAREILLRLKAPSALVKSVEQAVANHMRFAHVDKMRPAKWRRLIADPNFPVELELHRIDCMGSHRLLTNYLLLLDRIRELEAAGQEAVPLPLLTGRDLIALGIPPGPGMGKLLRHLNDLQLEGVVRTREEAIRALNEAR